ncbi:hypothetical protein ACGCUQ_00900 [Eubacteriales bacterium KG127]
MLRLENVKVTFKDKIALDMARTVEIFEGEKIGIIGEAIMT